MCLEFRPSRVRTWADWGEFISTGFYTAQIKKMFIVLFLDHSRVKVHSIWHRVDWREPIGRHVSVNLHHQEIQGTLPTGYKKGKHLHTYRWIIKL